MRIVQAAFELERVVQARGLDGRSVEIEAVGCELDDPSTAVAYVWFMGDDEPFAPGRFGRAGNR